MQAKVVNGNQGLRQNHHSGLQSILLGGAPNQYQKSLNGWRL